MQEFGNQGQGAIGFHQFSWIRTESSILPVMNKSGQAGWANEIAIIFADRRSEFQQHTDILEIHVAT